MAMGERETPDGRGEALGAETGEVPEWYGER